MTDNLVFWTLVVCVLVMALHLFYDFLVAPLLRDLLGSYLIRKRAEVWQLTEHEPRSSRLAAARKLSQVIDRTECRLHQISLKALSKAAIGKIDLDKAEEDIEDAGADFVKVAMDIKMAIILVALLNTGLLLFYSIIFIIPAVILKDEALRTWQRANNNAEALAFGA